MNSITFAVDDIVTVAGYQGYGRIIFISGAANVGVKIDCEGSILRIVTDLGKLRHKSVAR